VAVPNPADLFGYAQLDLAVDRAPNMTNSCFVSSADCPAAALRPFGLVALASNSGSQAALETALLNAN
jgi:hypothetical protein